MRKKLFSLVMACCIVFSLFAVCVVGTSADDASPPGNDTSAAYREPDMRYTQTCYIIPDSVNVAVGQSEYIQTSMGDHQIEHYTCFRWTSSDTSVATVDVYGNVTGVAPGTVTISLAFTAHSHMEFDTCEVEVIPIAEGTYFLQNKQTQRYADIENQSMSSGTRIHQWSFHGDLSQRWIFDYIGNGYYTIKSANSSVPYYLGVQNDSAAADTTIVLRTGTITDGMKWKVTQTSSGAYKLTAKCGAANNRVLAVGWSLLGINIDGIDIEQRDYSNDSDYIDEWMFEPSSIIFYGVTNAGHDHISCLSTIKNAIENGNWHDVTLKDGAISVNTCKNDLHSSRMFAIRSHGVVVRDSVSQNVITNGIQLNDALDNSDIVALFANSWGSMPSMSSYIYPSEDYTGLKIVLFIGCDTAIGGEYAQNLTSIIVQHGVITALGFSGEIACNAANVWTTNFYYKMLQGSTIQAATDYACSLSSESSGLRNVVICGDSTIKFPEN